MLSKRIPETDRGIQEESAVAAFNEMQRNLRDKGWIETKSLIKNGVSEGHALEIGHGPGYLGLEWLKNTKNTRLTGLDISPNMTALAKQNAREYGLEQHTEYLGGNGECLPFPDNSFDMVFANGSLHEWANPEGTFNEIWRVLKPNGKYFITDMRRDMSFLSRLFLWLAVKPASIHPGLISSINASYTLAELGSLARKTALKGCNIKKSFIGLNMSGSKI
jgi:ubiquinone/menaquinone biosynthesis C-methylase UbiE